MPIESTTPARALDKSSAEDRWEPATPASSTPPRRRRLRDDDAPGAGDDAEPTTLMKSPAAALSVTIPTRPSTAVLLQACRPWS